MNKNTHRMPITCVVIGAGTFPSSRNVGSADTWVSDLFLNIVSTGPPDDFPDVTQARGLLGAHLLLLSFLPVSSKHLHSATVRKQTLGYL